MTDVVKIESLWKETRCETWDELREAIDELCDRAGQPYPGFPRKDLLERLLAWRGQAVQQWRLQPTLDRKLPSSKDGVTDAVYSDWLRLEKKLLVDFASQAKPFVDETEGKYLSEKLNCPEVWGLLALARHYGLPTRVLDWTMAPRIAAYFACIHHFDEDGVIWWFNQVQLEAFIHKRWERWGVKKRCEIDPEFPRNKDQNPDERAIEVQAFSPDLSGTPWVTKMHYEIPFSRMQAQDAFMTVCRHLDKDHDAAIDEMDSKEKIGRGRIVISASMKEEARDKLKGLNVNSKTLQYPGLDDLARSITTALDQDRCREAESSSKKHCVLLGRED